MTLFDRNHAAARAPSGAPDRRTFRCMGVPIDQRRAHRRESDVRIDLAMDVLEGGFWHYDIQSGVFETSTHLARFIGGPDATPLDLDQYVARILPEDRALADLAPAIAAPTGRSIVEYRMTLLDGSVRWMRCTRRVVLGRNRRPTRLIGVAVDVTEQKWAHARIEQQARTDALTGLGNRRHFEERAALLLARAKNARKPFRVGVLMIDLDRFKPINDRYGHLTGDQVIQTIANRLAMAVRPVDLAARLGGDEFAILVDDPDTDSLASLARRLLAVIGEPMEIEGHTLAVGGSVGAALYGPGDATVQDLVKRADIALYDCKRRKEYCETAAVVRTPMRRSRARAVH